ncbi:alpha-L-fucosidase [Paradesertivirga mongoliensis]|uniref:alpha-L-fucosidase n=1 Tax=Paradesertivirga mongoliensis TaxID=2100740 RepID=A0ABW4ZKG7_9SPHI|nr:alpha-L-fucosidase [Pedobacter mongoliensis]
MMRKVLRSFIAGLSILSYTSVAQVVGDEDKDMFNHARKRDQQAIDEARNGWWAESMKTHDQRIAWWRDAKFGMFVHWGVYSDAAGEWKGKTVSGYAEHLMRKEKITRAEYLELAHRFNPVKFNADEWILSAKKAGMNYFIITAKHHDGFALWDSKVSEFDIKDQTPFKRDPLAELAAAAKKHGVKFGFYYSHAFDWEHPDAPGNDWEYQNPGGDKLLGGANWFDTHPEWLPKAVKYVDHKAIPQIKELINNYHPDILWFDTPHKLPLSENIRILKAIRETDPNIVVNGRLARSSSGNFGDYINTGDRPAEFRPVEGDWEAIPTTNESYGYSKHDNSHKPAKFFIQLLAKASSRGGNLLTNIGPKGDGSFDSKDKQILDSVGNWVAKYAESIYTTGRSALPLQAWGVTTQKGRKLYLHVFNWPKDGNLVLGGMKTDITKAYLLADVSKKNLTAKRVGNADHQIKVPFSSPDQSNAVIVVETSSEIKAEPIRRLATSGYTNRLLAFDAQVHGTGFGFGDGKTDRYFVDGWKSSDQHISWDVLLLQPAIYRIVIKYLPGSEAGSSYSVSLGDFKTTAQTLSGKAVAVVTQDLGMVNLNKARHRLTIKPLKIKGTELMKILEVQLIRVI